MKRYMHIWFDDRDSISNGFFYYTIMILTILSFLSPIIVLTLQDLKVEVNKSTINISIMLMYIGLFWLTGFLFPLAYNNINNLHKDDKR